VQSFAEILADEIARLDPSEVPPAAAFAPPARSLESGLRASLGMTFFVEETRPVPARVVAPAPRSAPVVVAAPREPAVDRLLRRFREQHVEPAIAELARHA
jgi:hypothetical protein